MDHSEGLLTVGNYAGRWASEDRLGQNRYRGMSFGQLLSFTRRLLSDGAT